MKWQAIIVLLAIALTVLAPPSIPLMVARGGYAEIGDLDVCHQAAPALSSAGDMPCMNECACKPCPTQSITFAEQSDPVINNSLFSSLDERPPKA